MYKIVIVLNDTELSITPGHDIHLPFKISGWNFEDEDLEFNLENELKYFILDFLNKRYRKSEI
jgi:hypothetical protein